MRSTKTSPPRRRKLTRQRGRSKRPRTPPLPPSSLTPNTSSPGPTLKPPTGTTSTTPPVPTTPAPRTTTRLTPSPTSIRARATDLRWRRWTGSHLSLLTTRPTATVAVGVVSRPIPHSITSRLLIPSILPTRRTPSFHPPIPMSLCSSSKSCSNSSSSNHNNSNSSKSSNSNRSTIFPTIPQFLQYDRPPLRLLRTTSMQSAGGPYRRVL
mmetsp:Transcript_22659/g.47063  ORF Transcript_22659/g.47063 Transcript_22659/m.47063 type:complete len:210 (+) Transcript_22659:377-1006(+)